MALASDRRIPARYFNQLSPRRKKQHDRTSGFLIYIFIFLFLYSTSSFPFLFPFPFPCPGLKVSRQAMAEPISPEAYLAIAATVHDAVNSYRGKRTPDGRNDRTANTGAADGSKATAALPTDELLSYAGLKIGNDGYVQLVADSPAHPRNWSRRKKAYDFGLTLFSEFFMSGISAAGTPASSDGVQSLGQSREVGLVAFTTMYVTESACFFLRGQVFGFLDRHTEKKKKADVRFEFSGTCSVRLWVRCCCLRTLTGSDAGRCMSARHASTASSAYRSPPLRTSQVFSSAGSSPASSLRFRP